MVRLKMDSVKVRCGLAKCPSCGTYYDPTYGGCPGCSSKHKPSKFYVSTFALIIVLFLLVMPSNAGVCGNRLFTVNCALIRLSVVPVAATVTAEAHSHMEAGSIDHK